MCIQFSQFQFIIRKHPRWYRYLLYPAFLIVLQIILKTLFRANLWFQKAQSLCLNDAAAAAAAAAADDDDDADVDDDDDDPALYCYVLLLIGALASML